MKKTLSSAVVWFMVIIMAASSVVIAKETTNDSPSSRAGVPVGVSKELATLIESRLGEAPMQLSAPATEHEWLTLQAAFDAPKNSLAKPLAESLNITVVSDTIGGVEVFLITPETVAPEYEDHWLMHIHGGAFVFGGGKSATIEAMWLANELGAKVVSVDYRQPPVHPFPAALEDTIAVWNVLMETQTPEGTAVFGSSAGGNLTLATTLKLQELGQPLPGALFVGTPAVDLKHTSDSWITLKGLDPLGQREGLIEGTFDVYAKGLDLANPLLSPVYAELEGFPPTILISGTRDLLLSDTVRMHRALRTANVDAQLHVYDGQSHGDYIASGLLHNAPESTDAANEIKRFFDQNLSR